MSKTLDRLYLEISNITTARNRREIDLATLVVRLSRALKSASVAPELVGQAEGFLVRHGMTNQNAFLRGDDGR